jgi:hypothetical protein
MPAVSLTLKNQSWYGELNFETSPVNDGKQQDVEVSARVRILQNRAISNHDRAILSHTLIPPTGTIQFDVIRAYHGIDAESGELITDLTLREVQQQYDITGIP